MRREEVEEEECQPRLNTNTKRLNCKPSRSPVPRLVLHFTQSLLHKKHPPPQPRVIINITEVDPGQPPATEAGQAEVEVTALK